jgi:hypothetical protein
VRLRVYKVAPASGQKIPSLEGWAFRPSGSLLSWTVHQVLHRGVVAATKSFTIVCTRAAFYVRVTILIAIVYVRPTMIVEVLPCSFDAIMITLTLNVLELLRRSVPATGLSITWCWRSVGLSNCETWSCK